MPMNAPKKRRAKLPPPVVTALIGLCLYVALFALLAARITPEQYDVRAGEVSPRTITATKDVRDEITTQARIEDALKAMSPSYVFDSSVQAAVLADLDGAFARLAAVRDWTVGPEGADKTTVMQAQVALEPITFTDSDIASLMEASDHALSEAASAGYALTRDALSSMLSTGQEEETLSKISRTLSSNGYEKNLIALVVKTIRAYLRPNMLIDEVATEAKRQEVIAAVDPVVYLMGQNIVRAGEVVTAAQIAMLDSLGMLKDKSLDLMMYFGVALLLLVVLLVVYVYLYIFHPRLLKDARAMLLLGTILLSVACVCALVQQVNIYLMPVTLGVMLTTVLLRPSLGLMVNLVLAVLTGLMASGSSGVFTASVFAVMLTSFASGSVSLLVLYRHQQRTSVLLSGLLVSACNVLTTFAVGLINNANVTSTASWAAWSAGSGVLASMLAIGMQPVLEGLFNLVTTAKLLELSNPNRPLIRRLILEASGTYHHSIIVANLAEAAADAVDANGLLARVGAYYHDVGKLKRPLYFMENQIGDNPHDRTDPMVSAAILTAHPRDGVEMGQRARLPQPVLDIIAQHHGDTPALYFYDRYVKQYGLDTANIADFRYDGPRPQTREAAIVMLADSVEAAARALPDPTQERIEALIRKLVRGKMDDRQLDESPLTLVDIDRICQAFSTVLAGVYHERIEYPAMDVPRRIAQRQAESAPKPESEEHAPAGGGQADGAIGH